MGNAAAPRLRGAGLVVSDAARDFDEATYDRTAQAFDNPDYVAIVTAN
ncbi:hypothetical protein ACFV9P_09175 [Streptomyces sp. NPDC059892]